MAFRLKYGALQGKYVCGIPSNASTNYIPVSSDEGCLVLASSNTLHGVTGASDMSISTTNPGGVRLMGIFVKPEYENDESSCSTFGSSSCKLWVQPIINGDVLDVDYSTDTDHTSGTSGDLHTTQIGSYYRIGHSSDSTTAVLASPVGSFINATTAINVMGTSRGHVFRLQGYSTKAKTVEVVFNDPMFTS